MKVYTVGFTHYTKPALSSYKQVGFLTDENKAKEYVAERNKVAKEFRASDIIKQITDFKNENNPYGNINSSIMETFINDLFSKYPSEYRMIYDFFIFEDSWSYTEVEEIVV